MAKTKFKLNIMQIIGIVCIALMIAIVVTQFLPFWTFGEDNTTVSIGDYTWFPNNYKTFLKDMKATLGVKELAVNDFVYPPVVLLLVSIFGLVFCPFKLGKPLGIAFNLAIGGIGIWMYLFNPIYQLGANWQLHLALSIALAALAFANMVIGLVKLFNANYEIVYTPAKKK